VVSESQPLLWRKGELRPWSGIVAGSRRLRAGAVAIAALFWLARRQRRARSRRAGRMERRVPRARARPAALRHRLRSGARAAAASGRQCEPPRRTAAPTPAAGGCGGGVGLVLCLPMLDYYRKLPAVSTKRAEEAGAHRRGRALAPRALAADLELCSHPAHRPSTECSRMGFGHALRYVAERRWWPGQLRRRRRHGRLRRRRGVLLGAERVRRSGDPRATAGALRAGRADRLRTWSWLRAGKPVRATPLSGRRSRRERSAEFRPLAHSPPSRVRVGATRRARGRAAADARSRWVPGARLVGAAEPGATVEAGLALRTQRGRRFDFRHARSGGCRWAVCPGAARTPAGSARAVSSAAHYQIESGGKMACGVRQGRAGPSAVSR